MLRLLSSLNWFWMRLHIKTPAAVEKDFPYWIIPRNKIRAYIWWWSLLWLRFLQIVRADVGGGGAFILPIGESWRSELVMHRVKCAFANQSRGKYGQRRSHSQVLQFVMLHPGMFVEKTEPTPRRTTNVMHKAEPRFQPGSFWLPAETLATCSTVMPEFPHQRNNLSLSHCFFFSFLLHWKVGGWFLGSV